MPPKSSKGYRSAVSLKYKAAAANKANKKNNKKRKRKKTAYSTFSYTLLPKRKRLATKVVAKLQNENDEYMIARGLDTIKRLSKGKAFEAASREELKWRIKKNRTGPDHRQWIENKVKNIRDRIIKRRQRADEKQEQELSRKRYRLHPLDTGYEYVEGYRKTRHRITKSRFMKCVDVPLLQEILNDSKDLFESPLWDDKLNFKNLSAEEAKKLLDHLYQFDVIVECLKQGIFDLPDADAYPIHLVRRLNTNDDNEVKNTERKKVLKRRLSFPPFKNSVDDLLVEDTEELSAKPAPEKGIRGALNYVANIITGSNPRLAQKTRAKEPIKKLNKELNKEARQSIATTSSATKMIPPMDAETEKVRKESVVSILEPPRKSIVMINKENVDESKSNVKRTSKSPLAFNSARKTSFEAFPPRTDSIASSNNEDEYGFNAKNPYGDLLAIKVPAEHTRQKKFIRALIEQKSRSNQNQGNRKAAAEAARREEEAARHRHERLEKLDPLQRLHPDEKDSDIWTVTSETTTDGYASWRRPRDTRNAGNKQDVLAHKVDTSFAWRVGLFLIIVWEIGCFIKSRIDDIYYWIFTSHLYRENIWLFEPTLFPNTEKFYAIHFQEWLHLFASAISLSIIHRENECVSLLFAVSLLFDGVIDLASSVHDYVYLPEGVDWLAVLLTSLHMVWKATIISLFIAYHYYSAGYIRKAREFKHRRSKLQNHEIKAKGTKGLQKRRMAWSWMISHARKTNLRELKKKFANVKDGNFPEEEAEDEIKFSETKELRLYTQKHNLNIGYPYNKLRDMKRFVFESLEKSDYTENDEIKEMQELQRKRSRLARRSTKALTVKKWRTWKSFKDEQDRRRSIAQSDTSSIPKPARKTFTSSPYGNLTLGPSRKMSILKLPD